MAPKSDARFRQKSPRQRKRRNTRKRLHQHDERDRHIRPRNEKTQRPAQQPRKRRIKNKSRLAESVIRPFGPPRKNDAFLPLPRNVEPRRRMKLEIVPRRAAVKEKRRHDQQRHDTRNRSGIQISAPAKSTGKLSSWRGRRGMRIGSAVMRRSQDCNRQQTSHANPIRACTVMQPER